MDDPEPLFSSIILSGYINRLSTETIIAFAALLLLLIFSALISGSEVAFFSLNPTEKEELNTTKTKINEQILTILNSPKRLLATILISNNFVNVAIIILSTYTINETFDFSSIPEWLNFLIQVVGITFVILLFGEVIPKIYATKHALSMAKIMVNPIIVLKKIFKPLSSLLIYSTRIIDKKVKRKGLDISIEELSRALDLTEDIPENKDEHRILRGIVRFGETSVKQVMKSRVDVIAVGNDISYEKLIETVLECGHSRIPVYEGSFDKIVGLIYVKDLLSHINENGNFKWQQLIRSPFFVPENKKLDDLLKEFQDKKIHLALVVDEYGGTSGIITLEDVLEEIVGDISDEFDVEDISYSKLDDKNYIFEGKTAITDVEKILDLDDDSIFVDVKKEVDTLAGLVIELAGKIPLKGEKVNFKDFNFIVEASDKRRVKRVKLVITK